MERELVSRREIGRFLRVSLGLPDDFGDGLAVVAYNGGTTFDDEHELRALPPDISSFLTRITTPATIERMAALEHVAATVLGELGFEQGQPWTYLREDGLGGPVERIALVKSGSWGRKDWRDFFLNWGLIVPAARICSHRRYLSHTAKCCVLETNAARLLYDSYANEVWTVNIGLLFRYHRPGVEVVEPTLDEPVLDEEFGEHLRRLVDELPRLREWQQVRALVWPQDDDRSHGTNLLGPTLRPTTWPPTPEWEHELESRLNALWAALPPRS